MSDYYMNNPRLKAAGVRIEFSMEQAMELMRCTKDPMYFIKKYVKIVNIDHGVVNFELWPFQERMIRSFIDNRFTICRVGRQSGKSTTTIAFLLYCILFTDPDKPYSIALLAHKEKQARELLNRLKFAYERLPFWMQQGVVRWNENDIKIENGSSILAAATSSGSVRGGTFNCIMLDEFAHVPYNIQMDFYTSTLPAVLSGKSSKVIITSTPKGFNYFYKLWKEASEGKNNYNVVDVHWSEVPGRDEKWYAETLELMGSEQQFNQEFNCLFGDASITVRNMYTGEIKVTTLSELYDELHSL